MSCHHAAPLPTHNAAPPAPMQAHHRDLIRYESQTKARAKHHKTLHCCCCTLQQKKVGLVLRTWDGFQHRNTHYSMPNNTHMGALWAPFLRWAVTCEKVWFTPPTSNVCSDATSDSSDATLHVLERASLKLSNAPLLALKFVLAAEKYLQLHGFGPARH